MEPKDFSRALLASMKSENVMQEMMSVAIRAISTEIAPIFEKMESLRRDINCLVTTEIADFKTKISDLTEVIKQKDERISSLEHRVASLESAIDDHEQYSRRNSLRLSGVAELPNENPADVVLATLNTRMKLDPPLVASELDRTHRVGPKAKGGSKHRSLLIKFATYRSRKRVFTQKKQLWSEDQSDARLFLNEDLTKRRSELLWKARKLKKEGRIRDAWSSDGKLLLKTMNNVIHPFRSIEEIMLRASPLSE
jgi:uncharacterized protein YoxC